MAAPIKVTNKIDVSSHVKGLGSPEFWLATANDFYMRMAKYTPFRTGALMSLTDITIPEDKKISESQAVGMAQKSGNIVGKHLKGSISYKAPYAKQTNEGHFSFRKDFHPLAQRRWQDVTWKLEKKKIVSFMQGYLKRYGNK